MHDEPTCGPDGRPVDKDAQRQNDVLRHLLNEYPAVFSVDELTAELTEPGDGFSARDGVSRAVGHLTQCGLLHRHGSFVWPTRAAKAAFGELRRASGRAPSNDLWIAATALAHDLTLVTRDDRLAAVPLVRVRHVR